MDHSFYIITWTDVFVSLSLVALCLALIKWWRIGLEKTILIGTIRAFIQLTIMGYVLTYFFGQNHWLFMVGLIIIMILIASYEATRRLDIPIKGYFAITAFSTMVTVIIVLGTILQFILDVEPWFYPYAMIPIAGMIIGNGLNSATLTTNRLVAELEHREDEIETLLSLGAPPRAAADGSIRESIRAALIPNINGLMLVGIVQIPGVMTGQIIAGVDPLIAVRYQIMIMYMWLTTATLANILTQGLVYKQFFTPLQQLKKELFRRGK